MKNSIWNDYYFFLCAGKYHLCIFILTKNNENFKYQSVSNVVHVTNFLKKLHKTTVKHQKNVKSVFVYKNLKKKNNYSWEK